MGQTVRLPNLAESSERIAADGADVVYEGSIVDAIIEEVRSNGGVLSKRDLCEFEPKFVQPVSTTRSTDYADTAVYSVTIDKSWSRVPVCGWATVRSRCYAWTTFVTRGPLGACSMSNSMS